MNEEHDGRIKAILDDPIYKKLPKRKRKIKIDPRFSGVFDDPKFTQKIYVDKRGRKVNVNHGEHLKMMYEVDDEQPNQQDIEIKQKPRQNINIRGEHINSDQSELDSDEMDDDGYNDPDNITDLQNDVLNKFKESIQNSIKSTINISNRLAVCNMDWDRIDANDIFMIFKSFLPKHGSINYVNVYISEYGKEKIFKETQYGPEYLINLLNNNHTSNSENNDDGDNVEIYNEAFREYQLQRMKYYYAVIEFDSKETADYIYNECDDMDYEHSAISLDVRFIPNNVTFDDQNLKSTCSILDDNYKPLDFYMDALQQTKLKLAWDQPDPKRMLLTSYKRKYTPDDIMTNSIELDNLIASPSSSEDDYNDDINTKSQTNSNRVNIYQQLLNQSNDSNDVGVDIEEFDTFNSDDNESNDSINLSEFQMPDNVKKAFQHDPFLTIRPSSKINITHDDDEDDHANKLDNNDSLEENDEIKRPKQQLGLHALMKQNKISKNKAKKIMKQRKLNKAEERFEIDTNDDRFSSLFTSSEFAIDPSNPRYRDSKSLNVVLQKQANQRSFIGIKPTFLPLNNNNSDNSIVELGDRIECDNQTKTLDHLLQAVKTIKPKSFSILKRKS